ncbi:hypothetical protein PF1751_v1c10700 [Pseudomonas simiae]|nr:hypothetical protein PF1751_v1c10700 [Pseudomonas simiae]
MLCALSTCRPGRDVPGQRFAAQSLHGSELKIPPQRTKTPKVLVAETAAGLRG